VVLDDRRHDDVVGLQAQAVREVVDRLGGVAADDRHVLAAGTPAEVKNCRPRLLVGHRGELGLVPRAAVDAGVPRKELGNAVRDGWKGAARRSRVEVQVRSLEAVDARHSQVVTNERSDGVPRSARSGRIR
jgi:hypothetical protein